MGNFSDDTFDPLKHYIGVRLQQGVPLVDADWNEQEDIRMYELQSFLKWFVGNGVPKGANNKENDGFKIEPAAGGGLNTILINSNRQEPGSSSIEIDIEASSAAPVLGFGPGNTSVKRWGSSPVRLTGNRTGDQDKKFNIQKGMTLTVKVDDSEEKKILFKQEGNYFAPELIETINSYGPEIFTASVGTGNDFVIKGGDGTTDGAGRCLVEGWEVLNERDIKYTEQELYENEDLANKWGVDPIEALSPPASGERMDLVYLDVWEREIDSLEDETLMNPAIGVETCVRLKREWAVRMAVGKNDLPTPPRNHFFYPLAVLNRSKAKGNAITAQDIIDHRRTGLAILSNEITIKDGKVGIGTTNPEDKLDVNGDIRVRGSDIKDADGTARISFTDNGSFLKDNKGAVALSIAKNGNVGIGTTNPEDKLDVNGDIRVKGSDIRDASGTSRITIKDNGYTFIKDASGSPRIGITDNDKLYLYAEGGIVALSIPMNGNVGIGGTTNPEDKLDVNGDIRVRGSDIKDAGGTARISITENGRLDLKEDGGKVALSIIQNGNVGIRTIEPEAPLHINGNASVIAGDLLILETNAIPFEPGAPIYGGGSLAFAGNYNKSAKIDAYFFAEGNVNNGDLRFYTKTLTSALTERMRITPEGNIGIGTIDPDDYKLYVNGHIYSPHGLDTKNQDYAEYFESFDLSTIPIGTSVTLIKDGKIKAASQGEVPMGIVSTNSAIVGNCYTEWPKKYLRDEFGNKIMEEYKEEIMVPKKEKVVKKRQKVEKKVISEEVKRKDVIFKKGKYIQKEITEKVTKEVEEPLFKEVNLYDSAGKNIIGKHRIPVMETYEEEIEAKDKNGKPVFLGSGEFVTKKRPKINPEYDESKEYIPRRDRPEWNCVGLLGQLPLRKGQPVAESWVKIKDISDEVELWLVK